MAEELAQDVFLQLYRCLATLESAAHITFWLRRVTSNRCIDFVRKRKSQPSVALDQVRELSITDEPGDPLLNLKLDLIGERPSGETRADSPLVEFALEATRTLGVAPRLDQSSTDSNLPISLGIPAITLGAGGSSGLSHSLDEWYDPRGRDLGLKRGLLVILGIVGHR